jgi:predicted ATP-dependent serine protease
MKCSICGTKHEKGVEQCFNCGNTLKEVKKARKTKKKTTKK